MRLKDTVITAGDVEWVVDDEDYESGTFRSKAEKKIVHCLRSKWFYILDFRNIEKLVLRWSLWILIILLSMDQFKNHCININKQSWRAWSIFILNLYCEAIQSFQIPLRKINDSSTLPLREILILVMSKYNIILLFYFN